MKLATFTPHTLVGDLLDQSPHLVRFILKKNLGCVGCAMVRFCTLEEVCRYYGFEFEDFIKELQDYESDRDFDE